MLFAPVISLTGVTCGAWAAWSGTELSLPQPWGLWVLAQAKAAASWPSARSPPAAQAPCRSRLGLLPGWGSAAGPSCSTCAQNPSCRQRAPPQPPSFCRNRLAAARSSSPQVISKWWHSYIHLPKCFYVCSPESAGKNRWRTGQLMNFSAHICWENTEYFTTCIAEKQLHWGANFSRVSSSSQETNRLMGAKPFSVWKYFSQMYFLQNSFFM